MVLIIYGVQVVNTDFHHLDKRFCPLKKTLELKWYRGLVRLLME